MLRCSRLSYPQCHSEMGNFSLALDHIDNAIALDSTDFDYVMEKADLFV